jgi:hypothetical protein
MDKISSIIPATKRVTSVDLENSLPVRAGVPTFGRPQAVSSGDVFSRSNQAMQLQSEQAPAVRKEPNPSIVDKLINDFFMKNDRPVVNRRDDDEELIIPAQKKVSSEVVSSEVDAITKEALNEQPSVDIFA